MGVCWGFVKGGKGGGGLYGGLCESLTSQSNGVNIFLYSSVIKLLFLCRVGVSHSVFVFSSFTRYSGG